ncbi:hypothetical protein K3495_g10936 [Podosphaera aphanis]|nr:hypothetical protein K3495_g10936 [Podosphaera aphanis]
MVPQDNPAYQLTHTPELVFVMFTRPDSSTLVTAAADLKVATPFDEEHCYNNNKNNNNNNNDCFIINKEHPKRSASFRPPQAAQQLVDDATRDPKIEAKIVSALEKWRKWNSKNNTIQIGDGLPPSKFDTYTTSLGGRIDGEEI